MERHTQNPKCIHDESTLNEVMSAPSQMLIDYQKQMDGDMIVLGVGGKMGVQLARMAKEASVQAGVERRIVGVSRFSEGGKREELEKHGIETISTDLSEPENVEKLPDAKNVVFMVGRKFGTSGSEDVTWAMNTLVPEYVARHYSASRITAFSTGNVYGLVPVTSGGSVEEDDPNPVGEYAISALGRERVFQYFSNRNGTETAIIRLNYAIDLRYGVLREIGEKVLGEKPIDLSMGNVNVIWQGDAINQILLSFSLASSPATVLNVTGPETVSVRYVARLFGTLFNKKPLFVGEESQTALLNNASYAASRFGYPSVPLRTMVEWIAHWLEIGGPSLDKPTHFSSRSGEF